MYSRVGADEGLPYGNITALASGAPHGIQQLWIGTAKGVAVWQPGGDPTWRYLNGPRWLAGGAVTDMCFVGDAVYVATELGVTRAVDTSSKGRCPSRCSDEATQPTRPHCGVYDA